MAKKNSSILFCKECGYESAKWLGQCPNCKEWNTFVESPKKSSSTPSLFGLGPSTLKDIDVSVENTVKTGYKELDRVLGGGIVSGSLVLVGGDPGIGKSTLLLQVCRNVSLNGKKVLYVSGEESLKQIKMRADRLGNFNDNLFLFCETSLNIIEDVIRNTMPSMIVIDSIQTIMKEDSDSVCGSSTQIKESTNLLMQLAKGLNIPIFVVGHVTKEGVVAGPRMLEHMVDTVLYFEGDRHASYRILRGVKNRFGSTNEIGVFEMRENGLREVLNPSEFMLSGKPEDVPGSVVACSIEGTRPILVEVQALVSRTNFGMPRRTSTGIDYNRVNLLMAVIEKRQRLALAECDAYVNIAGGMRINEPAIDLAIVLAIISSYRNKMVNSRTIVFGEVGLAGEIRAVSQTEKRVKEAIKLGFEICILPQVSMEQVKLIKGIKLIGLSNIKDLDRVLESVST